MKPASSVRRDNADRVYTKDGKKKPEAKIFASGFFFPSLRFASGTPPALPVEEARKKAYSLQASSEESG